MWIFFIWRYLSNYAEFSSFLFKAVAEKCQNLQSISLSKCVKHTGTRNIKIPSILKLIENCDLKKVDFSWLPVSFKIFYGQHNDSVYCNFPMTRNIAINSEIEEIEINILDHCWTLNMELTLSRHFLDTFRHI